MVKRDRSDSGRKAKKSSKRLKSEDSNSDQIVSEPPEGKGKERVVEKQAENAINEKRSQPKELKKAGKSKAAFLKKKFELVISLLPGALRNCEEAVERSIGQLLLKYSSGLGGILMAYENIKFEKQEKDLGRGWILNELPYIHFKVSCDALVFRPSVGCQVCINYRSE
jgi:hypothetical protein